MRRFAGLLTGLSALIVVGCTVVVLSGHFSALHWVLDFIGQFQLPALWIMMTAAIVLVAMMPFNKGHLVNLIFANAAVIVAAFGWYWLLPTAPDVDTDQSISVYQHNVWGNHPDPARTVEGAIEADRDITVLIEAYGDRLGPVEDRLRAHWPYYSLDKIEGRGPSGLRVYSRYEILSAVGQNPDGSPATLAVRLQTPEGVLTVLVIHFTRPWPFEDPEAQLRQLEGLLDVVDDIDGPLIMLGDVNSAAWGRIASPLVEEHGFTLVNDPRAGTWPSRMPLKFDVPSTDWPPAFSIPIDLAFCRGEIACGNHEVGRHLGSDHRSARFDVRLSGNE